MTTLGFATFAKIAPQDDGSIIVAGYCSTEALDKDGEIITAEAVRAALPDYKRFPAVREMHGPKAIGKALTIEVQPDGRTWFEAHIIDSDAVAKIKAGVLRAFSIGGKVLKRDRKRPNVVTAIRLSEVSLVDSPANPDCAMVLAKFDAPAPQHQPAAGLSYESPGALAQAAASHILSATAHDACIAAGYRPGSREYADQFGHAFAKAAALFNPTAAVTPSAAVGGGRQAPPSGPDAAPLLFSDIFKADGRAGRDGDGDGIYNEDDRRGTTSPGRSVATRAPGAAERHQRAMRADPGYRARHSDVVLEDRGRRRGEAWGAIGGAAVGGAAAAVAGARNPSRAAGVVGGAAVGAAAGVIRGVLRGMRKPGPWPSKVANAAFAAATELTRNTLRGAKAGARNPRAANALTAGAVGAAAGAAVGGPVGQFAGEVHDRIRTVRVVEKRDPDADLRAEAERLAALPDHERALELLKMSQLAAARVANLAKFSPSQPRDERGRFTEEGSGEAAGRIVGAVAGGVAGGAAAGLLSLPAGPASIAAGVAGEMAGSTIGSEVGGYLGREYDRLWPQDAAAREAARKREADRANILAAIKNAPPLTTTTPKG